MVFTLSILFFQKENTFLFNSFTIRYKDTETIA
jgi:hypothetical protein